MDNNERMALLHEGIIFAETIGSAKCQMDTEDARFLYDLARRADLVQKWQPIETAPTDGSVIMAGYWRAEGWFCSLYDAEVDAFDADNHGFSRNVAPLTHWMPLPAPPKGGA